MERDNFKRVEEKWHKYWKTNKLLVNEISKEILKKATIYKQEGIKKKRKKN